MLELSPFDACTNTGAETTVSKCFDAISQQSVKQKPFVAFYTPCENNVNTKGTQRSVDRSTVSLLSPSPVCLSETESESNPHTNRETGEEGGRHWQPHCPVICC